MNDLRIVLADIDQVFLDWAADQLEAQGDVARHTDLAEARRDAESSTGRTVFLLGPNLADGEALTAIRQVDQRTPHVACVFVASSPDAQLLTEALRAGVEDVLTYPFDSDELVEAIVRASMRAERPAEDALPTEDGELPAVHGRVVTVFSTKGGSGKSLVATNLALLLRRTTGKRVALVDLDLQSGDVAILMDLHSERGLLEASERLDSLDADALEGYLVQHASGLHVLTAPTDPSLAEGITGDAVNRVIGLLQERFEFVVIDGPAQFTEQVLGAFDATDTYILMASLDVPSIKNLRVAMNTLDQLGTPREAVRVCVNRANTKVGLTLKDVRKALGTEIHVTIPSSRDVPLSYNAASPLAIAQPRSEVVLAIADLLEHLGVEKPDLGQPKRRFLR